MCPRTGYSEMKKYMRLKLTVNLQRSEPLTNYKEGKHIILFFIILSLSFFMMYTLLERKKKTRRKGSVICVLWTLCSMNFPKFF